MTPEEKRLLLMELCMRSPYGVKVWRQGGDYVVSSIDIENQKVYLKVDFKAARGWWFDIEEVKPYLRPLSSMTEDEEREFEETLQYTQYTLESYDWLNEHHFDYRRLIEKGLALEATEGMYKIK